jgi:hypothetical protein
MMVSGGKEISNFYTHGIEIVCTKFASDVMLMSVSCSMFIRHRQFATSPSPAFEI